MATPRVFISYRRNDAPGHAGRLYDWIRREIQPQPDVFFDIGGIRGGEVFKRKIKTELEQKSSVVVVIGPGWKPEQLGEEDDYVRFEIKTAFSKNIHVLPVLVWGQKMPPKSSFPTSMVKLAGVQALSVRDESWADDFKAVRDALLNPSHGPLADEKTKVRIKKVADVLFQHADYRKLGDFLDKHELEKPRPGAGRARVVAEEFVDRPHIPFTSILSIKDLWSACESVGLKTTGSKAQLIDSLVAWVSTT